MKGSLQVKGGKYYAVIAYKDELGKDKRKWIATGLEEKGNKRKAEEKLNEIMKNYFNGEIIFNTNIKTDSNQLLFGDYLLQWLISIKNKVEEITYESYGRNINVLKHYFNDRKIGLKELKPYDIQEFYNNLYRKGRSGNTAVHYHVLMREALQNAIKLGLIEKNVADFVDRPKKEKYEASFYNKQELKELFEKIADDPMELIINITAYYGLRRSEILGLKWSAIDFDNKMIKINHKVVKANGKLIGKNKMKNKTSNRTLPLIPHIEKMLLAEKERQQSNKIMCGNCYCNKYQEYVCVNSLGELIKPDYLSQHFKVIQNKFELKQIRFHDLRHSCASLMLANGVPMKQIQEWLGHSTFQTTADTYAHLDYSSKISSAETISSALTFEEKKEATKDKVEKIVLEDEIIELQALLEEKQREQRRLKLRKEEAEM